ncbi:MAG: cyclic nucleotide-binding domain-containing protein, partial [Rhizobiaceae bacterium]
MNEINMRTFAANVGSNMRFPAGSVLFAQDQEGDCAYVVQSGSVELMVGDRKVDTCGENDTLGYMSLIDGANRTSTARADEDTQVS